MNNGNPKIIIIKYQKDKGKEMIYALLLETDAKRKPDSGQEVNCHLPALICQQITRNVTRIPHGNLSILKLSRELHARTTTARATRNFIEIQTTIYFLTHIAKTNLLKDLK